MKKIIVILVLKELANLINQNMLISKSLDIKNQDHQVKPWSCVDEDQIKEFLYETGPLAIALNADYLSSYTGGIVDYTSSKCPKSGINHAVTLVGYGTDASSSMDYWIVKNSSGKSRYITTATVSF